MFLQILWNEVRRSGVRRRRTPDLSKSEMGLEVCETRIVPSGTSPVTAVPENEMHVFDPETGRWHHAAVTSSGFTSSVGPRWDASVPWETYLGDVNGDGQIDLIGRRLDNGQLWVATNQGNGTFSTAYWGSWAAGVNFVDVTVGDFNGDGRADIIGRRTTGEWNVGLSTGSRFTTQFAGRWNASGWIRVLNGDFNGDGRIDFAGQQSGGEWFLAQSNGTQFVTARTMRWSPTGWAHVVTGDFDGDGKTDLAGLTNSGHWWAGISHGSGFQTRYAGRWSPVVNYQDIHVGDFDGDGRDDIAARTPQNQWYLNNNRDADTGAYFRSYWGSWNFATGWSHITTGDYDSDGATDIAGYLPSTGRWYVLYSQGAYFANYHVGTWPLNVG